MTSATQPSSATQPFHCGMSEIAFDALHGKHFEGKDALHSLEMLHKLDERGKLLATETSVASSQSGSVTVLPDSVKKLHHAMYLNEAGIDFSTGKMIDDKKVTSVYQGLRGTRLSREAMEGERLAASKRILEMEIAMYDVKDAVKAVLADPMATNDQKIEATNVLSTTHLLNGSGLTGRVETPGGADSDAS
ncbi:hypothetical protein OIO90_004672 [Microbotryomycetes sp. JL221]|nr:hypothetical protein OIO90_004672 [Microbotryomycetes sp. JL221]